MNILMSVRSVIHTVQNTVTHTPNTHSSRLILISVRTKCLKDIYTLLNSNLEMVLKFNLAPTE